MLKLFLFVTAIVLSGYSLVAQIHNPHNLSFHWKTDTTKRSVNLSDLNLAAMKDEIPTLDFPKFIDKYDPLFNFYEFEPVICVSFNGESKAYPLSLLTMYELSNDSVGGMQLMVTYCPRCNSGLVFNRKIERDGKEILLTFGISGLVMHNDMIMYDRQTETWWEQLMGEAITGELSGTELEMLPGLVISLKDYLDRYPEGKILSPEGLTPIMMEHGHTAFHHMEHGHKLDHHFYIPEKADPRLPPLEHVLDIHLTGKDIIFPFSEIAKVQVINDTSGRSPFVIFYHGETVSVLDQDTLSKSKKTGSATTFMSSLRGVKYTFSKSGDYFRDEQSGSVWDITGYCHEGPMKGKQLAAIPQSVHFAFAYLAFFPGVEIFGQ